MKFRGESELKLTFFNPKVTRVIFGLGEFRTQKMYLEKMDLSINPSD